MKIVIFSMWSALADSIFQAVFGGLINQNGHAIIRRGQAEQRALLNGGER